MKASALSWFLVSAIQISWRARFASSASFLGGLVHPTAGCGSGATLPRSPSRSRARRRRWRVRFEVKPRATIALAHPVDEAYEFLLTLRRRADDDQQALRIVLGCTWMPSAQKSLADRSRFSQCACRPPKPWNRQRRRGAPFDTPRIKPGATQGEGWVLGGRKSPSSTDRVGPKGRIEGRHAAADQSLSSTSRLVILPRPSTSVSITSSTLRKVPVPMPTPPQVPQTKMSPTSTSAMLEANSICSSGV